MDRTQEIGRRPEGENGLWVLIAEWAVGASARDEIEPVAAEFKGFQTQQERHAEQGAAHRGAIDRDLHVMEFDAADREAGDADRRALAAAVGGLVEAIIAER